MNCFKLIDPCNENWETMKPVKGGRFCKVCKKQVFDLSNPDPLPFKPGDVFCARFRGPSEEIITYKSLRLKGWNKWIGLASAFLLYFNKSNAQMKDSIAVSNDKFTIKMQETSSEKLIIKGIISDSKNKELLAFVDVSVKIRDSVIAGTLSDIEGKFEIKIERQLVSEKTFDLEFAYVGYQKKIIKNVPIKKSEYNVELDLNLCISVLGGTFYTYDPVLYDQSPHPSGRTYNREDYIRQKR